MTTFAPQTIENLHVHELPLPHENLKLKLKGDEVHAQILFSSKFVNSFRRIYCLQDQFGHGWIFINSSDR